MFIEDSAPETINVNVDGTNVIEEVPVTSSSVDEKGILTLSYKFEDLFIGGSLRMDYGKIIQRRPCVLDMISRYLRERTLQAVSGIMEQRQLH